MKTIGIDIDGVLALINSRYVIPALNEELVLEHEELVLEHEELVLEHCTPYDINMVTDFDYAKCLGTAAKRTAFSVFKRPDLYDELVLAPDAGKALKELRSRHRVICVSSPFEEHASSKWRFALRCGFDHRDIVLTFSKHLLKLDCLVDDRAETLIEPPYPGVLFDQPWNRWLKHPRRALGWPDVVALVEDAVA